MTSFKLLHAVRTDTGFHTTWLMVSELNGLKSCWLFFLEYHAREGVPDTHSKYRWAETSASSDVGRVGPQTSLQLTWYRCLQENQNISGLHIKVAYWRALAFGSTVQLAATHCPNELQTRRLQPCQLHPAMFSGNNSLFKVASITTY